METRKEMSLAGLYFHLSLSQSDSTTDLFSITNMTSSTLGAFPKGAQTPQRDRHTRSDLPERVIIH
jgi:hypothetical protein